MNNKQLRAVARRLQQEKLSQIKSECVRVCGWIRRIETIRPDLSEKLIQKISRCTKVSSKIPHIDLNIITNEFLKPIGIINSFYSNEILRLLLTRVSTIDYLIKDLKYLKREFKEVNCRAGALSVVTHDIVLKDFNFGTFEIIKQNNCALDDGLYVETKALDPRYPGDHDSDEVYPHPHVDYSTLCVGKGIPAIIKALQDFRFVDYFFLVNAILNTYGEGPHLEIEAWTGIQCNDCGASTTDYSNCYWCEKIYCSTCITACTCYENICGLCAETCKDCSVKSCDGCCSKCYGCQENLCDDCLKECYECEGWFCSNCMTKECDGCGINMCSECECSNCETE